MASTKFYLDCRRSKPGVPSVMKIAIGHGNKTSYISLEVKLLPTQWDAVRGKILNHPEKQVLNAYIYEVKQIVDAHIINLTRESRIKDMSANDIRDSILAELNPEKEEKVDESLFKVRFLKFIETKKASTKETYMHTLNRVKAYVGDAIETLRFEDITLDWLEKLSQFAPLLTK